MPVIVVEIYVGNLPEKERLQWIAKANDSNLRLIQRLHGSFAGAGVARHMHKNSVIISAAARPSRDVKGLDAERWIKDAEAQLNM